MRGLTTALSRAHLALHTSRFTPRASHLAFHRYAQGAILHIAAPNQENRNAVVKPLVALLEGRNAAAQMKSAETLAMLANRSAENRLVIAAAGAILPLVQLLGDGRNVNKSQVRALSATECD